MRPLYTYSGQDSPLHRLDPRTKLLFVICYLLATFFVPHSWVLFILIIVIIWIFGRIPPSEYYAFLLLMLPLMIGITVMHVVFVGGPPYFATIPIGPFTIGLSIPGLGTGSALAFRLGTMGVAFTMFAMTTEPFQWGMAMYRSGLPYKIAFLFAFAIRLYPLIQEEFLVIQTALRARASDALSSLNPFKFFPGIAISAVPLGLGAIRRSQEIALAMELRGLSIPETMGLKRELYREVKLRPVDYVIMIGSILGLGAIIAARYLGWFN